MTRVVDNGLPEDKEGKEGTDMFIQEDVLSEAYALYFSKFIDAYRQEGIDIFAVMPQNEFNSVADISKLLLDCKGTGKFCRQVSGTGYG